MPNVETLVEKACDVFNQGFNCSQSAFVALCGHWGMECDPKVAACFGGGIARTGSMCGVMTGSLMALGLLAGAGDPKDQATKERCTALGRQAIEALRAIQGHLDCSDLVGFDMSAPDGHEQSTKRGSKQAVCIPLMRSAMVMMDGFAKKEGLVK